MQYELEIIPEKEVFAGEEIFAGTGYTATSDASVGDPFQITKNGYLVKNDSSQEGNTCTHNSERMNKSIDSLKVLSNVVCHVLSS